MINTKTMDTTNTTKATRHNGAYIIVTQGGAGYEPYVLRVRSMRGRPEPECWAVVRVAYVYGSPRNRYHPMSYGSEGEIREQAAKLNSGPMNLDYNEHSIEFFPAPYYG